MLAKELPAGQFFRLLFLGSVRSPTTGRKLAVNARQKKIMNVIGVNLPILFLVIFVAGFIKLSWPNVVAFLIVVLGVYIAAMRSATLEEEEL